MSIVCTTLFGGRGVGGCRFVNSDGGGGWIISGGGNEKSINGDLWYY